MTTRFSSSSSCAEAGELAADAAVRAVADEQQQAAGAVVGAARVVVLGPPAELAPDHRQHALARARARRGRPARRAASRRGPAADRRAPWPARRACRSRRSRPSRRACRSRRRACARGCRAPCRDRCRDRPPAAARGLSSLASGARRSCVSIVLPYIVRTAARPGAWRGPARAGGRSGGRPSRPTRPGCRSRSREGEETRRDGRALAVQRRILAPADVDALQRVVVRADRVERAPEPAGAVGRRPDDAAAPVAARVEVRLVGVRVVDRRQHGHLARVVELAQAGRGWDASRSSACPPSGSAVAGSTPMRERSSRVARVAERHERVEAVVAAVEVERDEDRRVGRVGGLGGGRLEHAARREAGEAVGGQQQPDAARQQVAAREPAAALELRRARRARARGSARARPPPLRSAARVPCQSLQPRGISRPARRDRPAGPGAARARARASSA